MSKRAVISNSWVSTRLMATALAVRPNTGSPTARSAWAKAVDAVVAGHVAGVEVHLGHPLVVALQEAPEDLGQVAPLGRRPAGR